MLDGRRLFSNVTFDLGAERVAIVGRNGAGKSTLAAIMAGYLAPSSGRVEMLGSIYFVPQQPSFAERTRVADAFRSTRGFDAVGIRPHRVGAGEKDEGLPAYNWQLLEKAKAALKRFGFSQIGLDEPIADLSGGERTRLILAAATAASPDILILDEPTNHLDRLWRTRLYEFLDSWKETLLVVSRDRELLRRVDRIVELEVGGLHEYGGGPEIYLQQESEQQAPTKRRTSQRGSRAPCQS